MSSESRLSSAYRCALVHCVLPVRDNAGRIGVALRVPGEAPMRFALTTEDARVLQRLLAGYLGGGCISQSPTSGLVSALDHPVYQRAQEVERA